MSEITKTSVKSQDSVILPEAGSLILSSSPHVQAKDSVSKIMLKVIVCLLPAIVASVWFFGFDALRVIVLCTAFSMGFEFLWCMICRQPQTWRDYSAAVTGVILALNLSAAVPWWICLVGSFIAVIIAKQVFGGLGQNPFNPAAVARVALLVGFTDYMTQWPLTRPMLAEAATLSPGTGALPDIVTGATPLALAKAAEGSVDKISALQTSDCLYNYFIGNIGGSLGETSALALLIGGIGLIAFRLIKWHIPVAMLGTTFLFTWIVNLAYPGLTPGPLFHLMTGGMLIGALFMATDMVTSPMTNLGAFIFGAGIGLIACIIRIWGAYPEGVSFAIVIMNALVPLIDRLCYKRPFGWNPASGSALQMRRGEVK